MKLEIVNVGCYDNKTFDFVDDKITLIHGPSGSGKTTIIKSILFAILGIGNKLLKIGKKSCSVTLTLDKTMKIFRSKRPNRLIVNDQYEDDTAQSLIDERFGHHFNLVGCLLQKGLNNFVTMTPNDKLSFLEHFAFDSFNVTKFKENLKSFTKYQNIDLSSTCGKIEMCKSMLDRHIISNETLEFWEDFDYKETSSNIQSHIEQCEEDINTVQKTIQKLQGCRLDTEHFYRISEQFTSDKLKIMNETEHLDSQIRILNYDPNQNLKDIERYENIKNNVEQKQQVDQLKKDVEDETSRYESLKEETKQSILNEIQDIRSSLWSQHTREQCIDMINTFKNDISIHSQIKKQKSKLDKLVHVNILDLEEILKTLQLERHILVKKSSKIQKCPSCGVHLSIINDKLKISDTEQILEMNDIETCKKKLQDINKEIDTLEKKINKSKSNNEKYNTIQQDISDLEKDLKSSFEKDVLGQKLDSLEDYMSENLVKEKTLEKLETKLENKSYSESLKVLKKSIKKKKKLIKTVSSSLPDDIPSMQYSHIVDMISKLKEKQQKFDTLSCNKSRLERTIQNKRQSFINEKVNYLKKYDKMFEISEINDQLQCKEEILKNLYMDKKNFQELYQKTLRYEQFRKEVERNDELRDELKDLESQEKILTRKVTDCETLKSKLLECQSICMTNMIETINDRVNMFLEKFFNEDSMVVELKCFKEMKKIKKPRLNLNIEYKGMSCDISTLSGGELDRVILAFTLVLSEKFNTPILMLDECTSSLDQDLNTEVIQTIKSFFPNKTILMIAHQNIQGIYDNIIHL